ncbi:MAG: hypothetical protein V4488_07150 [Pseudomonadota bacterium]
MATNNLSALQAILQLALNLIIDTVGLFMPDIGIKFMVAPRGGSSELED